MAKKVKEMTASSKKEKTVIGKSGRTYIVSSHGVDFWNPEKVGDVIEGEYIEHLEFKAGKFAKNVNAKGEKVSVKPVILTDDGKQIALPDTKSVVKYFEEVEKGDFVMIKYLGKKIKKGQENKKNPESFHTYEFAKAAK